MKVFKFGGASVKNAAGIKNLGQIVSQSELPLVVVVSAFGKTTNALENVVEGLYEGKGDTQGILGTIFEDHISVIRDLGINDQALKEFMDNTFNRVSTFVSASKADDYDRDYDQVVSVGELWSTRIVSSWLEHLDMPCDWVDIRQVLYTDRRFRDANINWEKSGEIAGKVFAGSKKKVLITQGFIAGTEDGMTTTLGREGSDYTAAVIANMIDAGEVQVWKDVPGILNADPKWRDDAVVLEYLNYKEAVEMSFSGAKVIHPKTIKPLHNKNIPLIVRSFIDMGTSGTLITGTEPEETDVPVFIRKQDQILISIMSRDFSFAIGDNISKILNLFYEYGIKANMVQASAVSVAVCADDDGRRIRRLIAELEDEYLLVYNTGVELLTIRQYTDAAVAKVCDDREMLVEQRTRRTVQFVARMN
ncbi:MAG: aspartate kinase [Bacteroidales bacterium]|nr:aspartate kinase [Bacteroidales bacterium]